MRVLSHLQSEWEVFEMAMKKIFHLVALGSFLWGQSVLADVTVKPHEGGWSVTANAEPMTHVLKALEQQAGFEVSGTDKLLSDPAVNGTFRGSLALVLSQMLRGLDYATETVLDTNGHQKIVRLVVLSGEIGQEPTMQAVRTARKVPTPVSAADRAKHQQDGRRVASLLDTRARVGAGLPTNAPSSRQTDTRGGSGGITRNQNGSVDISPEAQAQLAATTKQAQANLEALVNALHQQEKNGGQ